MMEQEPQSPLNLETAEQELNTHNEMLFSESNLEPPSPVLNLDSSFKGGSNLNLEIVNMFRSSLIGGNNDLLKESSPARVKQASRRNTIYGIIPKKKSTKIRGQLSQQLMKKLSDKIEEKTGSIDLNKKAAIVEDQAKERTSMFDRFIISN